MAGVRWLLVAIPVSWVLAWLGTPALAVFAAAGLAVVPLAAEMGVATEVLAARTGAATGGLLNATFGNAAELIVAVVALRAGLVDLVCRLLLEKKKNGHVSRGEYRCGQMQQANGTREP